MLFRNQSRNCNWQRSIEPQKHRTSGSLRLALLFVTAFLAFHGSKCLASTSRATEDDGTTVTDVNLGDNTPAFTSNDPAPVVHPLPSGLVDGDKNPIGHLRSPKCILFPESFCRATRNKPILALTTMQTAALVSDGVTTRQFLRRGYVEIDPVTRILIGRKPTWARMAPLGVVQVVAGMWLAEQMASSRHNWVRRLWWLPQVIGIAGNAASSAHNVALR